VSCRGDCSKNLNVTKVSYFSCVSPVARTGIVFKIGHKPLTRARTHSLTSHDNTHVSLSAPHSQQLA
jgi:hypothetical protein